MVYIKTEYRYLITWGKKSKLLSVRVPKDFPLDTSETKILLAEMDRIISDEDLNYNIDVLKETNLSERCVGIIVKLLEYYKRRKPEIDKRMAEIEE